MAENNFRSDMLEEAIHTYGLDLDDNINWDNEKMIKALGDYFISLEPEKYSWGARYVQSLSTVMLCKHLKDFVEQMKPINPMESEDYVAETKVNGFRCASPDVELICSDGIKRKIKDIVDKKLKIEVLSFNEKDKKVEFQPIIGWYKNGKKHKDEWNRAHIGQHNQTTELTKDHKVYTFNKGYIESQKINNEDSLCKVYEGLNSTQEQILMGSFLGDGCIQSEKRSKKSIGAHRLLLSNCEKQLEYLTLKLKSLGKYAGRITKYTSGYGTTCYCAHTKPIIELSSYIKDLYEPIKGNSSHIQRRKTITSEFLSKLNWLGIAIWYMDDGSIKLSNEYLRVSNKHCRVNLAVNKFNDCELKIIQKFFLERGFETSLAKSKGSTHTLNIGSIASQEFFKQVAPYIPKCMEYKLPKELRNGKKVEWWNDNTAFQYKYMNIEGVQFKTAKCCKNKRKYQESYDIEVAKNHNFFADNILVHNCITTYSPEVGFEFFTRRESSSNYLNSNYKDKILLINKGVITEPSEYKGKFPYRFVIDGEIIMDGLEKEVVTSNISIEDYIQSIFSSGSEKARNFQKDGHPVKLIIFDVLYFQKAQDIDKGHVPQFSYSTPEVNLEEKRWVEEHFGKFLQSAGFKSAARAKKLYQYLITLKDTSKYDVRRLPFYKRRELRNKIVTFLNKNNLPFYEIEGEDTYKGAFLDELLNSGKEGIILKNRYAPYISDMRSSRGHRAAMKVKQSITNMLNSDSELMEDFDVFITGANPPKSSRIKDMIGSLKCSVYIKKEDGTLEEHEIASISGLPHEWKKKMAAINPNTGKICLNSEYEGKVIAINGLALTSGNLKFQHATLRNNGKIEFKAKNPSECVWEESVLKEMTMTRGE